MENVPERIVTLANPAGTRKKLAHHAIDRLREVFGNRVVERHTLPSAKDTTDILRSDIRAGDVVVTLGGDGTARTAVEALADPTLPASAATLLPLPYGFQNDLAKQLHTSHALGDPAQMIRRASTVDLTPLRVSLEHEGLEQYLSALYAGLGLMACTASHQDSAEYRDHWMYRTAATRNLYSMQLFPWAMRHVQPFHATVDGAERELLDASIANIPVLAKYLRPPVTLMEQQACYMEIEHKTVRDLGVYMARLAAQPYVKPPAHQMLTPLDKKVITLHDDTYLHTDGDARAVVAGTTVTFALNDSTYRAFTTRHNVSDQ